MQRIFPQTSRMQFPLSGCQALCNFVQMSREREEGFSLEGNQSTFGGLQAMYRVTMEACVGITRPTLSVQPPWSPSTFSALD